MEFEKAFAALNDQQKKAVTTIDGPLLVLAGPGTGKTQLLSSRVGYILKQTDVLPQNILCLTFTEAGTSAMRERLTRFLGQEAYDVNLSTYHSFGSDLLRRYPNYSGSYDFETIDELGADNLIRELLAKSSYDDPLKSADTYAADLRSFIGEAKKALLSPSQLRNLAAANLDFISSASEVVKETLVNFQRIDKSSHDLFEELYNRLSKIPAKKLAKLQTLKQISLEELATALNDAEGKNTKPITAWKNAWLAKDAEGAFIFAGREANLKITSAAAVFAAYQKELLRRKLFDYEDMILRAIEALEKNPDFKFTLAEQYQYILLDEFQDTNPAQFRLVELLSDNPVHEGRPNVMAVGDDDQAIYAFQGADHANMYRFAQIYRSVKVVPLHDNYRSHRDILDAAYGLSSQIKQRLHEQFEGINKVLKQAGRELPPKATIAHREFISDAAQYTWVAAEIKRLVQKEKLPLAEIAVLAPKHRYLIPLLPYLAAQKLPVRYEKRENVLDKPLNLQLEGMARLVVALRSRDLPAADNLWPEVLSYDFWKLPTEVIWKASWLADAAGADWTTTLLSEASTEAIASFFLRLKDLLATTNLEEQLDMLTGVDAEDTARHKLPMRSPFYEYYFGTKATKDSAYLEMLNDLSVLRGRLRDLRREEEGAFGLADFTGFLDMHRASGINILNTSPHYEAKDALNVMTAYQSKGREFSAVFVLAASDEVWGAASRQASSTISLPANLEYIRYQGGSDDERLRLLYVAVTRAKSHLYLTSYASTLDGKTTKPLKYLAGTTSLQALQAKATPQEITSQDLYNYWHLRHIPPFTPKLADLLEPKLERYQLSPTHLNQFTDVTSGGPETFFLNTILRFPSGTSPSAQFGTAIHSTIAWMHDMFSAHHKLPPTDRAQDFFDNQLKKMRLATEELALLSRRGQKALAAYREQRINSFVLTDQHEVNFKTEGVFAGQAHLAGKIDKLVFDKTSRTITVVDFKTGKSYDSWRRDVVKLHKYRQQLMVYKLLIEGSHSFAGWTVQKGVLEFVEPNAQGEIQCLELAFEREELDRLSGLLQAVWIHILRLDFPDISGYKPTIGGIRDFEADLIKSAP